MNIGKTALQFVILAALFFGLWFSLRQVNWLRLTHWQERSDALEQKLGDLVWKTYKKDERELDDEKTTQMVTRMVHNICRHNNIDSSTLHLHVMKNDEVNAFALPNGHMVIYSGLIASCNVEEELAAVLSHELAHMQAHHVMKKMIKEIGLTTISTVVAGNNNGQAMRKIMATISSTAYDRSLEKEADIKAVDYLCNAGINSAPFADFLYRIGESRDSSASYLSWVSTHPHSKERAHYILEYRKGKEGKIRKMADADWVLVHARMRSLTGKGNEDFSSTN